MARGPMPLRRRLAALVLAAAGATGCRAASGGVVLDFWGLGVEGEAVAQLIPEFEREHPGVHVHVQQIPWNAAHEKLLTAYVGRSTPDVAQLGNTWIPEFAALGALVPLDSFATDTAAVPRSDYFPGIWRTNLLGDTLYGIPWYVDTRVVFYRKDILARAGCTPFPASWPAWTSCMQAVKRDVGPGRWAIFLPTDEWFQPVILALETGSPILKDGGRYGAFTDPPFRTAFDFYLGLFDQGLSPRLGNNEIGNVYQEFARGRIAMWITGPWNIGEFRRRLPPDLQNDWGTAPLPGPAGPASSTSMAGGSSFVLFRGSRHRALAWDLIAYLSRPDVQARFYRITGDLPARESPWRSLGLSDDPLTRAFWDQLQHVTPLPQVPEWEEIATRVFEYADRAIRGGTPPDTALAELEREVNGLLERRRWLLARAAAGR